ncbi:glutathione S-transferase family protein [Nannocystaceae bacterium ST9]
MSTATITEGVLAELGTPCERVVLDIRSGATQTPAFLAINPNGRVPTIVHDGTAIWESAAITIYLGEAFGVDAGLFPGPGPERGEAIKWIVWASVTLAEAAGRLASSTPHGSEGGVEPGTRDWVPADQRSASAAAKAEQDLAACLGILAGGLQGGSFLLGQYSLADTHVQGIVGWITMLGVDLSPDVRAWLDRCRRRPALAGQFA